MDLSAHNEQATNEIRTLDGASRNASAKNAPNGNPRYVDSPIYSKSAYVPNQPLAIDRPATVTELCLQFNWLNTAAVRHAEPASDQLLLRFHDGEYIDELRYCDSLAKVTQSNRAGFNFGTMEKAIFKRIG